MPTLKKITYQGFHAFTGEVLYVIIENRCTFCGITPDTTSTVSTAENIIKAIIETENLQGKLVEIFDLLTPVTENHLQPGEFEYLRIVPYMNNDCFMGAEAARLPKSDCPKEIQQLFARQINAE